MKDRRRQNDLLSYRISILQSTYQQPDPMVVQGFIVDRRKESSEAAPSAMVLRSRGRIAGQLTLQYIRRARRSWKDENIHSTKENVYLEIRYKLYSAVFEYKKQDWAHSLAARDIQRRSDLNHSCTTFNRLLHLHMYISLIFVYRVQNRGSLSCNV